MNFKKIRKNAIKHDKAIQIKKYEESKHIIDAGSDHFNDFTDKDRLYHKQQEIEFDSKINNIFTSMDNGDFYELLQKINKEQNLMPNKKAKQRKTNRRRKNDELNKIGRTRKQVLKQRKKERKQNKGTTQ